MRLKTNAFRKAGGCVILMVEFGAELNGHKLVGRNWEKQDFTPVFSKLRSYISNLTKWHILLCWRSYKKVNQGSSAAWTCSVEPCLFMIGSHGTLPWEQGDCNQGYSRTPLNLQVSASLAYSLWHCLGSYIIGLAYYQSFLFWKGQSKQSFIANTIILFDRWLKILKGFDENE